MTPQDIQERVGHMRSRLIELETKLADPTIYANPVESRQVSREHRRLSAFFSTNERWEKLLVELQNNYQLIEEEEDAELREMVSADIAMLEQETAKLEAKVKQALLPPDPNDTRDIIIEIRPAAGGDESALFVSDLFRLYERYAEAKSWKLELLDLTASDLGGIKNVAFSLAGDDVYSRMKYESGVHRVQRIPATESGGRIHTSTVTVAVTPEAEEVDIAINQEDLRFDVFRSSGPGGQCVNTTDSAVRVTHLPTGLSVASQQEKSQHRNKEIALRILRSRLLEAKQREEAAKQAADKRAQVGTGDRSERIRTYNYPQNRVTDHRYNITLYDLPTLMEGSLDLLLDQIITIDNERRLAALNSV